MRKKRLKSQMRQGKRNFHCNPKVEWMLKLLEIVHYIQEDLNFEKNNYRFYMIIIYRYIHISIYLFRYISCIDIMHSIYHMINISIYLHFFAIPTQGVPTSSKRTAYSSKTPNNLNLVIFAIEHASYSHHNLSNIGFEIDILELHANFCHSKNRYCACYVHLHD
jgi:hypothetical protein